MNSIVSIQIKATMTSREIAELTGKPHSDLMKSIRLMEEAWLSVGQGKFSLTYYTDQWNRKQPQYELNKKECLYIATKFNDEARARLVLRWEELETQNGVPKNFAQALRLAAQQAEELELKELQLQLQAPKVDYYNNVLQSESVITTTKIAKELGMSAHRLNELLHRQRVIFPHAGSWVLYSQYDGKGYTKTKTHAYLDKSGRYQTSIQTVWTEEGRQFIHSIVKGTN